MLSVFCVRVVTESLNFVLSIMYIYYKRLGLGALTRAFHLKCSGLGALTTQKQQIAGESDIVSTKVGVLCTG